MECPKCNSQVPDGAKFCKECGTKLQLTCPACGKSVPPDSKFCLECGAKLEELIETERPEPAGEGERKRVTVLFSDLSGYTAMSERLDPEEVKEIMSRIFGLIAEVIAKYEGFIEKYVGDAVMALFGVPEAHEDDPIRAIRAAREIHTLVQAMGPELEKRIGQPISMHSGINSGLVVTGEADVERGTHGVLGDTINVAARLSSLAKDDEILVGPVTYRRAEGYFNFEGPQVIRVKGKIEAIPIYKALSSKETPTKTHHPSGLRAELIGRKAELAQLHEAVERLKQGKASVIAICGDAGTGKSRLVEEFKTSLDLSKIRWREGHAYQYSQNIPYFPLMDLMNRAWRIEEGDPPEKVRTKVESGVERLLGTREDVAPYIGSLYALSYPEIDEVSPEFWKARLFEGIQSVVSALTQYAPTIFCFEDIHWADPSMLDLLRFLLSDPKYPALFISVHRLPFSLFSAHQLSAMGERYEEIRLLDLSPSDTLGMVESLLQVDSVPGELRKFMQKKVEGNPFYVEEAINSLVETGALARDNGAWKLTRPLSEADIPPTVQGVISARLDRLEREMKRVLQEASVIGRAFFHEILKRVTALQDSLDRSLRGLEMLDLVRVRSLQPDLEYIFKHALTQEVVYNGLLKKERRDIHERIGVVIEQLFHDRISEFYETLSFHFKRGRSLLKAVDYLMKSGEKSLKKCAVEESHQYFQEAFDLLAEERTKTRVEDELIIDLIISWALVFYYRGDFKGLGDLLTGHEDLAQSLQDRARLGMFYAWVGWTLAWRENFKESYQCLRKALKLGEEIENQQIIGYACTWLTWVCPELGRLDEALSHGRRAQEIAKGLPSDQYLYFKSLGAIGWAYWYKGESKKTLEVGRRITEFGERHSNNRSVVMGRFIIACSASVDGDYPSAIEYTRRTLQASLDPFYSMFPTILFAFGYLATGQLPEARQAAQQVVNFSRHYGTEWIGRMAHVALGVVSIAEGDVRKGLEMLEEDRLACLGNERRSFYTAIEHAMATVYSQIALTEEQFGPATKKAEGHFDRVIEIAGEIGAKGKLAQAYLDLGRLHKAKKGKEKARECLSKAIEYFELCEAETFLGQAREELESLG